VDAARRLSYRPDAAGRSLDMQQTHTIALVLYQCADRIVGDAFLPNVVRGLSDAAKRQGFRLLLHPFDQFGDSDAYISLVLENRIDGLIVSGPRLDHEQLPRLQEEDFPVVLVRQLEASELPYVDVDNRAAARAAVTHLHQLGHRRIASVSNAPQEYIAAVAGWRGYRDALEREGIAYDEGLVRWGNFDAESGHTAMGDLLNRPDRREPDAADHRLLDTELIIREWCGQGSPSRKEEDAD